MIKKLEAIKAECERLLKLAELRTPGKWIEDACCCYAEHQLNFDGKAESRPIVEAYPHNISFIAACAGPAEAGWRITIDRINELLPFVELCIERGISGEWIDKANKLISNWEYRY